MLLKRDSKTKNEGMENDTSCKWKPKKSGVTILIRDKLGFETDPITKDKERYYILIKESI